VPWYAQRAQQLAAVVGLSLPTALDATFQYFLLMRSAQE
jgi:hypothetical protein